MNVAERRGGRKSLKERLGIAGIGCCAGAGWSCRATSDISVREEDEEEERHLQGEEPTNLADIPEEVNAISQVFTTEATEVPTVSKRLRVSLMRLLEEGDGVGDEGREKKEGRGKEDGGEGSDGACCICMGRRKGAAFIPCGHTFCRVCSRELWLNRPSCPVCNRSIVEILDIY
ncbi:hypothetical protein IFM89_030663 [Coptis chinensis]|uniref:RING-type domain-containing protein n=1 Tax=Coptis chinensis TaxID=261450 RepID=A0A835H1W0_9MAGN|nr:hypothetical protein IFM89_030663 [Coptis chinensis]